MLTNVNKGKYIVSVVMENVVNKWGVVPYREIVEGDLEFLIVSTKSGRWGLPKGNLMKKLGPKETARQEAFEEAGIIGTIVDRKISAKVKGKKIAFFPMEVKNEFSVWPESDWRKRKWIRSDETGNYLNQNALKTLLKGVSEKILQSCS